ncbi:MAG: L-rhamnose isomerase [Treponema sp.]|nr:L-rhamnose isomerase [Treponema sp.]
MTAYELAKDFYAQYGIDTEAAMKKLDDIHISMHCWQGDDVQGFENQGALTGGIQATGSYPGKARNPQELMADIDKTFSLIPGKHRLNLHASYAIPADGKPVDRNKLKPEDFAAWVSFAKERGLGIDFNPTLFSHPLSEDATLSSENEEIRKFWVDHVICCLKISEYFANELNTYCCMNIWIPDGFKNVPANRTEPRARLKKSLDEILATPYDRSKVKVCVESKVFGIGVESCTVGSHEFYMNYAAKNNIMCLLDNGHFHPQEYVSDKISSMLLFADQVALHVTRPVRWDSDHVISLDDETKAIAYEIVQAGPEKVLLATDYFDASINRIAAWAIGMRNMQRALLTALLFPQADATKLQNERNFSELFALQESFKTYPVGAVWDEYCSRHNVAVEAEWFKEVKKYEKDVLSLRK